MAAAKSLQSCPTLCDPINSSPPGSSVPGILQARILEWVAISFSNAWKWKVKVKLLSRAWLSDPMDCRLSVSSIHGIFQARVLEWGAISFSNAWKWKVKVKSLGYVRLMTDSDGCTTVWMYLMPPTLKVAIIINFCVCISHNKKIKIEKEVWHTKRKKNMRAELS